EFLNLGPQVRVLSGALPITPVDRQSAAPRAFVFGFQCADQQQGGWQEPSGCMRSIEAFCWTPDRTSAPRSEPPQPLLERLPSRAADAQTSSPSQLNLVVASLAPQECVHEVEAHDCPPCGPPGERGRSAGYVTRYRDTPPQLSGKTIRALRSALRNDRPPAER